MGLFTPNSSLASIVRDLISFINLCVGVLAALAMVIFFWGLVKYIYHSDDANSREEGKSTIMWGLIALFVLFSLFGILQILDIAFFGGASVGTGVDVSNYGTYGGTSGNLDPIH